MTTYKSPEKQMFLEEIEELRSKMAVAQSRFDNKDPLDAERTSQKSDLAAKIAELTQKLRSAQTELDDLNSKGSIRDEFIAEAGSFEQNIVGLASGVFNYVLDRLSQEKYEANHRELPPLMKEEILFRADRLGIKRLANGAFARLSKHRKEQITNEVVNAAMERVFDATETLEKVLNK
jgi:hypothetical protein